MRDLRVSFDLGEQGEAVAVDGISFAIPQGRTVALVGESGSGKSVTAMALTRLLPDNARIGPASQVLYGGRNLLQEPMSALRALRGREIGYVFQDPHSALNPVFTVGDQLVEALRLHMPLGRRQALHRAAELLDQVGIGEARSRLGAYPHELSGGQQQRVMIAAAIACNPRLLVADEPTTALDVTVQRQIVELLQGLRDRLNLSVLFISHDLGLVGEFADRVVVMRAGRVRERGDVAQVFSAPRDDYTRALIACRPPLDHKPRRLPVIEDFLRGAQAGAAAAPLPAPNPAKASFAAGARPAADGGVPLLEVEGLRKEYRLKTGLWRRRSLVAVQDASFSLGRGRTLGVVGESGSGKSTLGMMLMQLLAPSRGEVRFAGQDLAGLDRVQRKTFRRRVQIIFQNPYASLNPRFTIGQILAEPMRIHGLGGTAAQQQQAIVQLLDRVGLPASSLGKYPHEFSGGQRQRIAIARCLSLQPELLICDESVSALDVSVQASVLNLLRDLQDEFAMSYVFISHDLAVVRYMADELLVMAKGEIVERGAAEAIYANPQHPYTQRLLASIPRGYVARAA